MQIKRIHYTLFAAVLLILAGCGAGGADIERGEAIFRGDVAIEGVEFACIECHAVEPGASADIMGQNLSNIGNRAANTVPGQSAEEYLRIAIVNPDAFLSGGFQEGIHPRNYGSALSNRDIADLIAYMSSLRSGQD